MADKANAPSSSEATSPPSSRKRPSKDDSPHAMVEASLEDAMKERESTVASSNAEKNVRWSSKRFKGDHGAEKNDSDKEQDLKESLLAIWSGAKDEKCLEKAFKDTMGLAGKQIESMIRFGLDAFHQCESSAEELKLLKDEMEGKNMELERLRAAEEKSRASISNLLRAVDTSKEIARDTSRAALVEAGLRAELSVMSSRRDEAQNLADESKRKCILLEEEVRQVKMKLSRVTQEKIKMERDQRATMSLAKSLDHHVSSDVEYYKRKCNEQQGHIQGMNAVIAEKNRQVDEMRRQMERNMSQNRLAKIRNNEAGNKGRRSV